jgi:hypothetical protein
VTSVTSRSTSLAEEEVIQDSSLAAKAIAAGAVDNNGARKDSAKQGNRTCARGPGPKGSSMATSGGAKCGAGKGFAKPKSGDGATVLCDENFPALGGASVATAAATASADGGGDPVRPVAPLPYAEALKNRPQAQGAKSKAQSTVPDGTDAAPPPAAATATTLADDVTREMLGLSVDD